MRGRGEIDRCIEELDSGMSQMKRAMSGIPFRRGGFKADHDSLRRDVATLTVLLDSARALKNG